MEAFESLQLKKQKLKYEIDVMINLQSEQQKRVLKEAQRLGEIAIENEVKIKSKISEIEEIGVQLLKQEEDGLRAVEIECKECSNLAVIDYNGHGHPVCNRCYNVLSNQFDNEYQ